MLCVYCGVYEAPEPRPYCVHCTFLVRVEIEYGLRKLDDYLAHWAAFDEWEQANKRGLHVL